MNKNMIEQFWDKYRKLNPEVPEHFQAWSFGSNAAMADELANLVVAGRKTATASNYLLYELTNEPLPKVGDLSIVLNGSQLPVCIIQTQSVEVIPFNEVTVEQAQKEGEGDLSLDYWRTEHRKFFGAEFKTLDREFSEDIPVVCETFKVVFS